MKPAKRLVTAALLGILSVPFIPTAQAQSKCKPRGINARQQRQQTRIYRGVRSGELTRRETLGLQKQQARIAVHEARARRSGGEFTARERARIGREQNQASRNIYRQKHDRQDLN